jgi:hypothetical protein
VLGHGETCSVRVSKAEGSLLEAIEDVVFYLLFLRLEVLKMKMRVRI